jgi:hypothetical protein
VSVGANFAQRGMPTLRCVKLSGKLPAARAAVALPARERRGGCAFRIAHLGFRHMKKSTLQCSINPPYGKKQFHNAEFVSKLLIYIDVMQCLL